MTQKTLSFLFSLLFFLSFSFVQTTTQYKYYGLFNQWRDQITTSKGGESVTYSSFVEQCSFDNRKGKLNSVQSYSISSTYSRTSSPSATVGINILGIEIKSILGGESSFSTTKTISSQVTVPPGQVGHVYLRDKKTTVVLLHKIQPQIQKDGSWVANPNESSRVERSYVTTISPDIKLELTK